MIRLSDIAQLAIDLGKATFDNFYFSFATLQTMAEDRVAAMARDACPAACPLPPVVDAWIGLLRRTRADLKATVDYCVAVVSGDVVPGSSTPLTTSDSVPGFGLDSTISAGTSRTH